MLSNIHSWVPIVKRMICAIEVISLYCYTIAIIDSSYEYELIWSQLPTNSFLSPRACESGLSYAKPVHNGLLIAAMNRTLNLLTLYWSQIYSILQLSCFAIYQMESILHHSGLLNPKSYLPWPRSCVCNKGWFVQVYSLDRTVIYPWLVIKLSPISLCVTRDTIVVWYWWHHISLGMNHWSCKALFG